jgi:hypothetical protein
MKMKKSLKIMNALKIFSKNNWQLLMISEIVKIQIELKVTFQIKKLKILILNIINREEETSKN